MNSYFLIAAVSTISGSVITCIAGTLLIRRLPLMLSDLPQHLADSLRPAFSGKENFDNIRPFIEEHIDDFLRHRLGTEMPMIGMFIGDKTIAQLKAVFMKELEDIFPLVIDRYLHLMAGNTPSATNQSSLLLQHKVSAVVKAVFVNRIYLLAAGGAAAGLLIGLLQLLALRLAS